ncbi:MAG: hypothetical protein V4606_00625 [Patescibacteria group bacterium]
MCPGIGCDIGRYGIIKLMIEGVKKSKIMFAVGIPLLFMGAFGVHSMNVSKVTYDKNAVTSGTTTQAQANGGLAPTETVAPTWPLALDTAEYDKRLLALVHYTPPKPVTVGTTSTSTLAVKPILPTYSSTSNVTIEGKRWPAEAVYPNGGAILPFKRILSYYGNFYSRHMGILGEFEPDEVLRRLNATKALWEAADPDTPIQLAIEYIAMVAQADAGRDGMYRAMMPATEIEKAYALAKKAEAILILDMQIGLSPIETELPKFKMYLERPEVHLALDPEFSMKTGDRPGTVIGTHSAADINYVINYMSTIVRENKLPPKVLLVHRFTQNMVTGSAMITPTPEVQVIMVMDGWGPKDLKRGTYGQVIVPEPVQFTGLKIFYKNDLKAPSTGIFTPQEVLQLNPKPIFIQYQ